ncbi:MAG: hypothetical protein U0457_14925 [Candidatus Sericytochromatia bacterium]
MKFTNLILSTFLVASLGACSNQLPTTQVNSSTDTEVASFSVESLTPELQAKYPDLKKELDALKDLPKDQKKTKMDELKKKYPELATMKGHGKGGFGKGGFAGHPGKGGFGKGGFGGPGFGMDLAKDNPQLKADMDALRKKQMDEMKALLDKYPDVKAKMEAKKKEMMDKLKQSNPELAAELEKLQAQNLSQEEMMKKMKELHDKYGKKGMPQKK